QKRSPVSVVFDPQTCLSEIGEHALLKHLRARIPAIGNTVLGIGDDAAAVETTPLTLITTDCLVEKVHFRLDWTPPALLGRKALSINLSDIAAMGGIPRYATISLCLRNETQLAFIDGFYDGLLARAAEVGVAIVGGNVAATEGPLTIDITLLGMGDRLLRRGGAQPGDHIVVTGRLGAASAGLRLLKEGARLDEVGAIATTGCWTDTSTDAIVSCLRAHLDPLPPLTFARALAERDMAHAAIDLSDGLSGDLLSVCEESGVAAWIDPARLPIDEHASAFARARGGEALGMALHGGEDYQLLLAVPSASMDAVRDEALVWDLPIARIGEFIVGQPGVFLKTPDGLSPLAPLAHEHFKARASARSHGGA
ncbi:MAG: thiamine-phosphate kinase, partial [Vicinamibacteria bacterium]|nr:thiamine-phosphate kinase [Vicinamibacteria bacterium]